MLDTNLSSNELSEPSSEYEESLRLPWPDWFPPVYVHSPYGFSNHNAGTYHNDPDVRIAKNSTPPEHKLQEALAASDRIMETYLREESLKGIAANLCGQTTYVVSPVKPSYPSGNILARAFAEAVANELGLRMASGVYQNPRMKRDKKTDFFVRLSHPTEFFADPSKNIEDVIIPGADYIIADDVLTYGGTLAGLRAFIECHGGRVICMTTLAGMPAQWRGRCLKGLSKQQIANYDGCIFGNPPGEFPIAVAATTCSQLQLYKDGVFQGFFEKELGYGINCFTQREAVGILRRLKSHQGGFSLDFWRKRIVRARGESYGSSSV